MNEMNTKTRFLEKIRYYCDRDFFTEYHHLPDESIAMQIIGRQIELYQGGVAGLFARENIVSNLHSIINSIVYILKSLSTNPLS
ncbi:hypothetical protein [Roseofilum casamattae]|uniref:Uncharacterized protein n=1 Tax=Roseofilum casamattae BLCC-M143 TaxID=3022442 RepID=A0ABT7BZV8_9CYAN|nr:hypothetical protein [Roseofilum casamattae]MDJ1184742.1 hypothetical protein [Roseofilum casamattae BLCC-M143]